MVSPTGGELGTDWSLQFAACSGAKIQHLHVAQDSRVPPQKSAFEHGADLVTVSMGGNDASFADILTSCAFPAYRGPCQSGYSRVVDHALFDLRSGLPGLYQALRGYARPGARIIVVGYPRLFPKNPTGSCNTGAGVSFRREDMLWMNRSQLRLNALIADSAAKAGVSFVDPTELFVSDGQRHDLCIDSDRQRWINRIIPSHKEWSFHPKVAAHDAEAKLVLACIANAEVCRPRLPSPLADVRWQSVLTDLGCTYVHPPTRSAVAVRGVSYADIDGDRVLDAFVVAACESPTSSNPEVVHVFDGASVPDRPRRLGRLLSRDPAYVRRVTVDVSGRTVLVRGVAQSDRAPLCCPDLSFSQPFTWTGRNFKAGPRTLGPLREAGPDGPTTGGLTGDQYAFLTSVDPGRGVVTFDVIQWFEGAAAARACREDGVVSRDVWCQEYYYRNTSTLLRIMPLARGAPVTRWNQTDPRAAPEPTTLAAVADQASRGVRAPYRLSIKGNTITGLHEIFTP